MHMLVLETHRLSFNTGIIMITNSYFVHDTCQLPAQFRHVPMETAAEVLSVREVLASGAIP